MATEPTSTPSERTDAPSTALPSAATPPSTPGARAPSRAPLLAVVLAIAAPGSVAALWLAPRPADPAEMPPLVVPSRDAARTEAWIHRLADSRAETAEGETDERRELYLEHGRQEIRPTSSPDDARTRDRRLAALADELAEAGQLEAVRAYEVEATLAALRVSGEERIGDTGAFPRLLEQYGAIVEGRRVAPTIVVEALAWARWNGVHDRVLTEGMNETLLRGYHGWLAYYGPSEGTELRDAALVEYVRARGMRGLESEAFLRLSRGDTTGARLAFEAAYEATGNVRLRNHALALGILELEAEDEHPAIDAEGS